MKTTSNIYASLFAFLCLLCLGMSNTYGQQTLAVQINNHAHCTNKHEVELEFNYPGGEQMMISKEPNFMHVAWEPYKAVKKWRISGQDGKKMLYVKFRDAARNESDVYEAHIILDTQAPLPGKIQINDGETMTMYSDVLLKMTPRDAEQMWISNDKNFATGQWEPYVNTKKWILQEGDGQRTIYIKYRDSCGNISRIVSKSITVSYN